MKTGATGGRYKTVRSERAVFGHGQKYQHVSDSVLFLHTAVTPQESLISHKKPDIESACVKNLFRPAEIFFTLVYIAWVAVINPVIPVD